MLGGAALTRGYVEQDLSELFEGDVRYARDAFEGLRLMDALMAGRRGGGGRHQAVRAPGPRQVRRAGPARRRAGSGRVDLPARSDVARQPDPDAAVLGRPGRQGHRAGRLRRLPRRAGDLHGAVGAARFRGSGGPSYEELVESDGRPRLRYWLDRFETEGILEAAVVYGYFPCVSKGEDLIVLDQAGNERTRFTFPRQRRERRLCLADFFRSEDSGEVDVVGFTVVTSATDQQVHQRTVRGQRLPRLPRGARPVGPAHRGAGRVLAPAHPRGTRPARRRRDVEPGPADVEEYFKLGYRGARFSLGYGACPDLEDRAKIVSLLHPERINVELSEEFQLHPEQSTDAIVVHHPEAKYFSA